MFHLASPPPLAYGHGHTIIPIADVLAFLQEYARRNHGGFRFSDLTIDIFERLSERYPPIIHRTVIASLPGLDSVKRRSEMRPQVIKITQLTALFIIFKLARLNLMFANSHANATPNKS